MYSIHIDEFNESEYNRAYIEDKQEYAMVMSAIKTQDKENTYPGEVRKVYAYNRSYLYTYDKNGQPVIIKQANESNTRNSRGDYIVNYDREGLDVITDRIRSRQRDNIDDNRFSDNRQTSSANDRFSDREISRKRRSDGAGYVESDDNPNDREEVYSIPEQTAELLKHKGMVLLC